MDTPYKPWEKKKKKKKYASDGIENCGLKEFPCWVINKNVFMYLWRLKALFLQV